MMLLHLPPLYQGKRNNPTCNCLSVFVSSVCPPPGESKRKTLPSWLREELEKMERQRQKKAEKEAKEAARREQSDRPTWRDELDEEEETEEGRERHRATRSYRYSRSKSPNKVCDVVCR